MPKELFLLGLDSSWSELGVPTSNVIGCVTSIEKAEKRCTTDDHWYMTLYPASGTTGRKFYPQKED